ncbi:hypothetical protein WR25_21442 [Diploscapter pachys]|uniref:Uncharacterized protein n=1 Tax=Diploscapter pachys TaxID=2018661 RepID=A0A2A2M2Q7_9BILA|nr:hypothetical protein WR25_21442 [Diploscapter pachys]
MADEIGVGDDIIGKAAIDRIAGVELALAQCLPPPQAMHAVAAGGVEPRHAHPVAFLDMLDALADRRDIADALMPRDEGRVGLDRPVALGGVQVGVADARRLDRDLDQAVADLGNGDFIDGERGTEFADDGCLHGLGHGYSPLE